MPSHSRNVHEVHGRWRSAVVQREPPSIDSPVSTSDEGANSHGSPDRWGQSLETKREKTVRIVFQNIAGLSCDDQVREMKLDVLKQWMTRNQVDIFGCVKLGICWDLEEYKRRLPQATRGWWEAVQWSLGYNQLERHPSVAQPSSTGIAVFNCLAHHAQKAGDDPTGLGRWSWIQLQGKGRQITHIVALYHPCSSNGPLSTYQQHCRGLAKLD